jgi:hypothetical protein
MSVFDSRPPTITRSPLVKPRARGFGGSGTGPGWPKSARDDRSWSL